MTKQRDLVRQLTSCRGFPIRLFRQIRFRHGIVCPHCDHSRIHRWGSFGWRRRYRCLGCRRTFSDFTGTPLAYLKRIELWPRFCLLSLQVPTVRDAARRLGIHVTTSFRWRHRLLSGLLRTESAELGGRVSVSLKWFPRSEKGSRTLSRPARRTAFRGYFSHECDAEWVVFASADDGQSFAKAIGRRLPTPRSVQWALTSHVVSGSTLLSRPNHRGIIDQAASRLGCDFEREVARRGHERVLTPTSARLHVLRLMRWLRRFFGVATRYLENYLVWFRLMELVARPEARQSLGPLLAGAFP